MLSWMSTATFNRFPEPWNGLGSVSRAESSGGPASPPNFKGPMRLGLPLRPTIFVSVTE